MKRTLSVAAILAAAALSLPAFAQDKAPAKDAPKPAAPAAKPADAKPAAPAAKPADAKPAAPAATKPADAKPGAAPAGGMPADAMAMMAPGPEHAKLKPFEGKWNCAIKTWMDPTQPEPKSETAVSTYTWELDGRYLMMDVTGSFEGMPFHGMGVLGYNRMTKQLESGWIDNFGTGVSKATGQMDAAGKVITMTEDTIDPMSGKPTKMRQVITWTGADSFKEEFFSTPQGGKEAKTMEILATRAK